MRTFKQNVELDARGVLAAMRGGIDGYMNWAFHHRDQFPSTNDAMDRANWLKKQPSDYLNKVSKRAAELESSLKD